MSKNREQLSDSDESTDDQTKDLIQENQKKKTVKEGKKVKKEEKNTKKLSDISPPKLRKTLHNVMLKYHTKNFYYTTDIAKKILSRLQVTITSYAMRKIKQAMENWIKENESDSESDEDSLDFNILDKQKDKKPNITIKPSIQAEKSAESQEVTKKTVNSAITEDQNLEVSPGDEQINSSVDAKKTVNNFEAVKKEKIIPVIDLTLELKKEVKVEIITIDEETHESTPVSGNIPVIPYQVIPGYNQRMPCEYFPGVPYFPHYQNPVYNPYMLLYGSQYPYPYYYGPPSDLLPNYPVDETSFPNPNPNVNNAAKQMDAHEEETVQGSNASNSMQL